MIAFHRFLIASAILFCGGFAVWSIVAFRTEGRLLPLGMGIAFALAAGLLTYYLKNLNRFLGR